MIHVTIRILLILLVAVAPVASFADTTIKVMSFNVRYGTAPDGVNAWHQRKDLVVDVIRQYDPVVVGTQECLDFQADYIVQALPDYRWFGVGREADGRGEFMAVLYKPRVLSPIDSGNFWLSETPDVPGSSSWNSACNRMVTWARFYHIESKQFFYFYNTHLDHKSEPVRQGGATVLAGKLAGLAADARYSLKRLRRGRRQQRSLPHSYRRRTERCVVRSIGTGTCAM